MAHPFVINVKNDGCDVYCGRPGPWGNPFSDGDRSYNIQRYRTHLMNRPALVERAMKELKGKVLGCWCAPKPCHADLLATIANSGFASHHEAIEALRLFAVG